MMIVAWLSTDGHPLQIAVAGPQARAVPAAAPGPAGTSGSDRGQGRDRLFHFEERRTVLGEQSLAGELDRHRRRIAGQMGEQAGAGARTEERRVGKEGDSKGRSRGSTAQ